MAAGAVGASSNQSGRGGNGDAAWFVWSFVVFVCDSRCRRARRFVGAEIAKEGAGEVSMLGPMGVWEDERVDDDEVLGGRCGVDVDPTRVVPSVIVDDDGCPDPDILSIKLFLLGFTYCSAPNLSHRCLALTRSSSLTHTAGCTRS